eukprot:2241561-Rhodomonas_salina.1
MEGERGRGKRDLAYGTSTVPAVSLRTIWIVPSSRPRIVICEPPPSSVNSLLLLVPLSVAAACAACACARGTERGGEN